VDPEGLLEQSARFVGIAGTMPRGLGLRDYHQAPVRFEAAVARETILSLSPLLFHLQTPLPVHVARSHQKLSTASTTDSRGCLHARRCPADAG
jgi:hypothetical protein